MDGSAGGPATHVRTYADAGGPLLDSTCLPACAAVPKGPARLSQGRPVRPAAPVKSWFRSVRLDPIPIDFSSRVSTGAGPTVAVVLAELVGSNGNGVPWDPLRVRPSCQPQS